MRSHFRSRLKSGLSLEETERGVKVTNTKIASKALVKLQEWRKQDGTLCDVVLKVQREEIPAHKNILAVNSDYFRAMFTIGLQETDSSKVELDLMHASPGAIHSVIDYMYTGILQSSRDHIQDVLIVADMLQMAELKNLCCDYLARYIDGANCLDMLQYGEKYSCPGLVEKSLRLIKQRFPAVCDTESFLKLPAPLLAHLLGLEDLSLGSEGEDVIVQGLLSWLADDTTNKMADMVGLCRLVRWQAVSEKMVDLFHKHPLVLENLELCDAVKNLREACSDNIARRPQQYIYVIGGYLQSRTGPRCPRLETVERYDVSSRCWETLCNLPVAASAVFPLNFRGRLLCLLLEYNQGESDLQEYRGLLEYNVLSDKWEDVSSASSARCLQLVHDCVLKRGTLAFDADRDALYVIAHDRIDACVLAEGDDGNIVLDSLTSLPPVPELEDRNCVDMGAVVHRGALYVLGGSAMESQTELFPRGEVYRWQNNAWQARASMRHPRARFAIVNIENHIYVIGGFNAYRVNRVERFSPTDNTWTAVAGMGKPRSHLAAVVLGGQIYAMGGKSYAFGCGGARKVLNTCEVYDPKTDAWTHTEQAMAHNRCMMGAVVL